MIIENLHFLGKSSLVLGIFFCCYKAFLERETFYAFNRYFLLAGLFASLILPLLVYTKMVYVAPISASGIEIAQNLDRFNDAYLVSKSFLDLTIVFRLLWYLYIIGVSFFTLRFVWSLLWVLRFCACLPPKAGKHECTKENGFCYINVNGLPTPFSFFNIIAYDSDAASAEELELILAHEREHAKQWHSVDLLLGRLLCALFWFNPFVWFYAKAMEQNLEYLADAKVTERGFPKREYQLALVRVSSGKTPALTQSFYQSFIKKRIIMLNKNKSKSQRKFRTVFILPLLALFIYGFNVKEVQVVEGIPTKEARTITPSTISGDSNTTPFNYKGKSESKNLKSSPRSTPERTGQQDKSFRYIIKKNSTKQEIDAIAAKLKEDDKVDLKYSALDYNDAGLITSLKVKMKDLTKDNNVNFSQSSIDGIEDIILFRNGDGGLGFTSAKTTSQTKSTTSRSNDGATSSFSTTTLEESEQKINSRKAAMERRSTVVEATKANLEARKKNLGEQKEDLKKMQKQLEEQQLKLDEMQQELDRQTAALQKGDINASNSPNSNDKVSFPDDNILILVDGKEKDREYMDNLNPEDIKSINVIKGEKELKAYGKKADGKNGVIEITTKKGNTNN